MKRGLTSVANSIRKDAIQMLAQQGVGNTATNLSVADILAALYFTTLNHKPRKPQWKDGDKVFVSNQFSEAWQATLAHAGYFSKKDLLQPTRMQAKTEEHGISMAVGSALAAKIDSHPKRTYCIISDAEHHRGHTWETVMLAGKHKLNNLTLIIDRNNTQEDGYIENIMPIEPLGAKYAAFNWHVIEVDGHNIQHITEALNEAKNVTTKPTAIIAHTIPGRGVSFMENNHEYHGRAPSKQEEAEALRELK